MPIYEYACTACGERTEAKQSFDDPPLETCEICGGKLRKLYSPVGVVFKGSGFYSTDTKSKSSKSSSSAKETPPADKSEKKTDPASSKADKKDSGSSSATSKTKESGS